MTERICEVCGAKFYTNENNPTKVCSDLCATKWTSVRNYYRWSRNIVIMTSENSVIKAKKAIIDYLKSHQMASVRQIIEEMDIKPMAIVLALEEMDSVGQIQKIKIPKIATK